MTPATAFAPGSPNAGSVVDKALAGKLPGIGTLSMPGFNGSATSTSGDAMQGGSSTGDGFNVNFGNGVSQGGAIPGYVWIVAAAAVGLWAWKRFA